MPKYSNWLTKQLSKLKNSNFPKNSKFAKHWKWGILKTVFDGESDVGDLTLVTIKGCWWQNIPISSPTSVTNIDVTVFNSWVGYWIVLSNLNIDRWTWKVRSMFISTNFHNFVPLPVIFFFSIFFLLDQNRLLQNRLKCTIRVGKIPQNGKICLLVNQPTHSDQFAFRCVGD